MCVVSATWFIFTARCCASSCIIYACVVSQRLNASCPNERRIVVWGSGFLTPKILISTGSTQSTVAEGTRDELSRLKFCLTQRERPALEAPALHTLRLIARQS